MSIYQNLCFPVKSTYVDIQATVVHPHAVMIHLADASLAGAAVVRSRGLRQLQLSASQTTKSLVEGVRRVGRVGREPTVRSQKKDPLWSTHTDKLPGSACTSGPLKRSHPASFKLASDQITWRMTYMMNPSQIVAHHCITAVIMPVQNVHTTSNSGAFWISLLLWEATLLL